MFQYLLHVKEASYIRDLYKSMHVSIGTSEWSDEHSLTQAGIFGATIAKAVVPIIELDLVETATDTGAR